MYLGVDWKVLGTRNWVAWPIELLAQSGRGMDRHDGTRQRVSGAGAGGGRIVQSSNCVCDIRLGTAWSSRTTRIVYRVGRSSGRMESRGTDRHIRRRKGRRAKKVKNELGMGDGIGRRRFLGDRVADAEGRFDGAGRAAGGWGDGRDNAAGALRAY